MHKKWLIILVALGLFVSNSSVFAIEEIKEESEPSKLRLFLQESDYLTGDWGGLRSRLEERGIDIYGTFVATPTAMGQRSKAKGSYRNAFILRTELDSERMGLYKGGKFVVQYMAANSGTNPSEYLGTYSELDCLAPEKNMSQIAQLYYEHTFKDDLLSLKVGKQNANEDFHETENGALFLSHSYHSAPNIPMPDCITPQMGVRAKLKVRENAYVQTGIYDGNIRENATPKGFFTGENGYVVFSEAQYFSNFKKREGKYMLGSWLHSSQRGERFEKFNSAGGNEKYNHGAYFAFEQKLFNTFEDNSGGLSVLGQFSWAPSNINEVPLYSSLGLVYSGIGKKRKEDKAGVALAWNQYNNALRNAENKTSEKVVELFYKFKVTNFLSIKPVMQYIIRPEGNGTNSFAFGVRTVLAF